MDTVFTIQTITEEDKQQLLDQIVLYNSKLDLLERTQEIEEKERDIMVQNIEIRKEKFEKIRSKNDAESMRIANETMFKQDEALRRDLLAKMVSLKDSDGSSFILGPVIDVLENFEGKPSHHYFCLSHCTNELFFIYSNSYVILYSYLFDRILE